MECKLNDLPHGHMRGHRLLDILPHKSSDKNKSSVILALKKINEMDEYR